MLDQVFRERGFQTLWCEVLADNEAVWKLHQSFGFEVVEHIWPTAPSRLASPRMRCGCG